MGQLNSQLVHIPHQYMVLPNPAPFPPGPDSRLAALPCIYRLVTYGPYTACRQLDVF
jgi:hypothetical protein